MNILFYMAYPAQNFPSLVPGPILELFSISFIVEQGMRLGNLPSRGGHYHRSRVTIYDRDQNILIRKNGFDRLIISTNTA